jgi:hypothetical protein
MATALCVVDGTPPRRSSEMMERNMRAELTACADCRLEA